LKILVSAADKASSAGFWAHFNIVTYYYYYYYYNLLFSQATVVNIGVSNVLNSKYTGS